MCEKQSNATCIFCRRKEHRQITDSKILVPADPSPTSTRKSATLQWWHWIYTVHMWHQALYNTDVALRQGTFKVIWKCTASRANQTVLWTWLGLSWRIPPYIPPHQSLILIFRTRPRGHYKQSKLSLLGFFNSEVAWNAFTQINN